MRRLPASPPPPLLHHEDGLASLSIYPSRDGETDAPLPCRAAHETSFVPPACYGTQPCVARPVGYTVHWETREEAAGSNRKPQGASLYVPVLEAHRMEPAKKMRLRTAATFAARAAASVDHGKDERREPKGQKAVFSHECAQALPGGQQALVGTQHSVGTTVEASGDQAPTCDCDAAYRMGKSERPSSAHLCNAASPLSLAALEAARAPACCRGSRWCE